MTLCGFWRVCLDVNHLCLDAACPVSHCVAGRALATRNSRRRNLACSAKRKCAQRAWRSGNEIALLSCKRKRVPRRAHRRGKQEAWIAWQAQHFCKVGYRFRGRRCTFRKFRDRYRGWRRVFARPGADFAAGASLSPARDGAIGRRMDR